MSLLLLFLATLYHDFFETEQEKDFETILFELEELKNKPIDLNTASLEELLKIPFLKPADGLKIIGYRERYGLFESVDDISKIKGFEPGLIELIKPYVMVKVKPVRRRGLENRIRLQKEWNKSEKYYTRTKLDLNDYHIFLVTEKDPYESSFFDYHSAGVIIEENKRRFALGSYNLDYGSGIMLSSTGSFFSSTDFRIITHERGIIPYTSTIENGGFFGAALSDTLFLNYCLFYSHQRLDGRIDTAGYARSFDPSGNHVDSASIARKDRIQEEIIGYYINYKKSNFQLNHSTYWSGYEPAFVCTDSMNDFYGRNYFLTGLGCKYNAERFIIFGEIARSFQNSLGSIFGWTGLLPYHFEFNLAGKYFNPNFYAPKGIEAEKDYIGLFIDLRNRSRIIDAGTALNVYTNSEADTNHYDLRLNFTKAIGFAEAKFTFRWLYRQDEKRLSGSRAFLRIRPQKSIYLDLRLEDKYIYEDTMKKGLFAGLELGFERNFISLKTRIGVFDTDSYSSRIYVYEPDLPGIINNRVFYGIGRYGFFYFNFKPIKKIAISVKWTAIEKDSLITYIGAQLETKM